MTPKGGMVSEQIPPPFLFSPWFNQKHLIIKLVKEHEHPLFGGKSNVYLS